MSSPTRYDRFVQASRNMALSPLLEPAEIEAFRVEYSQRTLVRLKHAVADASANGKIIFAGHRGCGKSTLLNRFAELMREQGRFVVFFTIDDMVEMSDVNHINILYSIALQLLSQATRQRIPISEQTKTTLQNWFLETKSRTYTDQLKQEFSVGLDFYNLLIGKLLREDTFREEIKLTYERRVSELSTNIDRISTAIQTATKKEVLVIVDGLDKLDLPLVEAIYRDNINALFSPNIQVVFTIPISVVRDPRLRTNLESACERIVLLAVTKFYTQDQAHLPDGEVILPNVETLEAILRKRIDDDLIEPETLRQLVLLSGGVLRELIRLGRECCRECMVELDLASNNPSVTINADILSIAVKNIRNQYARSLGSKLYQLLGEIYNQFAPPDARDPDFLELLHGLYVLEYENDDLWYDLHPLITDLLRRKKILPSAGESA